MKQMPSPNCTLRLAARGELEPCPRERCPYWEPGGAVLAGDCLIHRLGIDPRRADLAGFLLETRERLEDARNRAQAEQAHREFSRRVGLEL